MNDVQCRMARSALGLGVRDLAALASVSPDTIARLERGETLREATVADIRAALEKAGVEFIPENGGGAGVRLAKRGRKKSARSADRAAELAEKAIDHHTKDAPAEERAIRKRRILKGPSSFRGVRKN